ncbi:MAG: ABC-F family ATP-binding cassette domain-containing protein [Anaerolineales bacterium]|nr:ABC-F family ATP-binding cassette domain-containing protein [Anaerolineales bacterium]
MPILTITDLGHSFGAEDIFSDINLMLKRKERVGLVGPNGVGKTTLLLILAGLLESTSGTVQRSYELTIGYLRQEAVLTFTGQNNTVFEEMLTVFTALTQFETQLREMETAMTAGDLSQELFERYGRIQEQYEIAGGYEYQVNIKRVLQGLGFPAEQWQTPLTHLSGGQKTRVLLGRLLLEKPDLLILDEPTNHLDITAIEWLEHTLRQWPGALIIVSHDRYFIDKIVNHVWELNTDGLRSFRGNYSSYVKQRRALLEREMHLFTAEKERMTAELEFIRKHIAGGKTDIAKGKLKRLTRDIVLLEDVGVSGIEGRSWLEIGERVRTFSANEAARRIHALQPPHTGPPQLKIRLQADERSARSVLRSKQLQIGYTDVPLFTTGAIQLDRYDCAALIGPNGCGKSTLLRTILGEVPSISGSLKFGDSVVVGYFAQAHEQLNPENQVLDELLEHKPMSLEDARNYLAQYLFRGDDVFKQINMLSGGERGRLALALLAADGANFLLLDEPTNHLDIPSQEVLQSVLEGFDGTILLVSHDRYLASRLANQIWEIENGRMQTFKGSYEDYIRWHDQETETLLSVDVDSDWTADLPPAPPIGKKAQREQQHRRYVLQNAIDDLEFQLHQLEFELNRANGIGDAKQVERLDEEITAVQTELKTLHSEFDQL